MLRIIRCCGIATTSLCGEVVATMTTVPPLVLVVVAPAQLLSRVVMLATDPILLMALPCGVLTRIPLSLPLARQTAGTNIWPAKLLILVLISVLLL